MGIEDLQRHGSVPAARIDNSDGTWSYTLPTSFDVKSKLVVGPFTYRYAGQAKFGAVGETETREYSFRWSAAERQPKSLEEQLKSTRFTDEHGRTWVVESLDTDALIRTGPDAFEEIEAARDTAEPSESSSLEYDYAEGEVIRWIPTAWVANECSSSSPGAESHVWNGESRFAVTSPEAPRQRAAVKVFSPRGSCSGVLITHRWVLTAAHCITTASGNEVHKGDIDVRLDWAGETQVGVASRFYAPGWNPTPLNTDFGDDYALIKLNSTFSAGPPEMELSGAGNTQLQGVGPNFQNLGFGSFFPGCALNSELLQSRNFDVTGYFPKVLRFTGDSGNGHSGGPVYYCPEDEDDWCGLGESGYVVAVIAGWNPVVSRQVGSRVSAFKDWAVNIMASF